ncbi:hypothetical protein Tco_0627396 [Tanacetum coccineum]|uniref:Reverse transcriptase Ty1/copia-type domain-containing protein n=1 Tax=Tanacetum coccineum TaxID=301880 RepID=A0ABQ4WMC1_9ASTR
MPHELPLYNVHSLGRDEGSLSLNELTVLCTSLSEKVSSLESELKNTKETYSSTLTRIILRVKKLEKQVQTTNSRRKTRIILSEDEDVVEDHSNQGRIIEEIDADTDITLVTLIKVSSQSDQSEDHLRVLTATKVLAEAAKQGRGVGLTQTYTRRRRNVGTGSGGVSTASELDSTAGGKAKDKGKEIMQEHEPLKKLKKRVQVQISMDEEISKKMFEEEQAKLDAREEVPAEATQAIQAHEIDWNDPSVLRYHAQLNRPYSIAEVRKNMIVYLKNQGGYKMSYFKESKEKAKERMKRNTSKAREDKIKRQKTKDDPKNSHSWSMYKLCLTLKKQLIEMLNDFDRADLIVLYKLFNEKYASTRLRFDDLMLWGDIKIMFNLDENVEKKYPLPQDTLTRMLRWKLHVNYEILEMAYELLKFIRDSNSLNFMTEKGPWMVNGKPLIVQKWNHELGMQMGEHRNPLIMDINTVTMCHNGIGGLDYARVLVEMDVDKEFKKVFGHEFKGCTIRPRTLEEEEVVKRKEEELNNPKNDNMEKIWSLLDDNPIEFNTLKDRMIVDQFLNKKIQPSVMEISKWSNDMVKYFKERWEEDRKRDADNDVQKDRSMKSDEEDIVSEVNRMRENVIANEIPGRGKRPNWLFGFGYLTDSMNYQPVRSENQANKTAVQKKLVIVKSSEAKNEGEKPNKDTGLKTNEEPEFAQSTKYLLLQAGAARATSTNTVNTVSTPLSTANPSNVFSTGGPSYPDLTNYADQDVLKSCSEDSSIHTTNGTQILGDLKLAVQTKSKVNKSSGAHALVSYIQKQRRNNHKDFQHCLFARFLSQVKPKKISKALDDESWVDAMQEELLQFKIQKVWILVDLPFGKKAIRTKWVYMMNKKMKMRINVGRYSFGSTKRLGGYKFSIDEKYILDKSDKYVAEILKKFDFASVKTASTLIETQKPLTKDGEAADVDVHLYRSMIGSLMYLTTFRPDIMFAVYGCSRFQDTYVHGNSRSKTIVATSKQQMQNNFASLANCNMQVFSKTKQIENMHHISLGYAYERTYPRSCKGLAKQGRNVGNTQHIHQRRRNVGTGSGGVSTASEYDNTAGGKAKDKGKEIMQEPEPPKTQEEEQAKDEFGRSLTDKEADAREEVPAEATQATQEHEIDWNDPLVLR